MVDSAKQPIRSLQNSKKFTKTKQKYDLTSFFSSPQGLELNQKFPIGKYLADNNIVPGGEYTGETIVNVLKPYLDGQNAGLQCDLLHDYSNPVLYQISICFDKNFNIIGCEKSAGGIYGKCKQSEYNKYPKNEILPNRQETTSIGEFFQ